VLAVGSGGPFALAAARALLKHTSLTPTEIVREALNVAGEICIYSNRSIVVEEAP
jgi:ATP-dependent HslUV protease, peptidase subunit HslV